MTVILELLGAHWKGILIILIILGLAFYGYVEHNNYALAQAKLVACQNTNTTLNKQIEDQNASITKYKTAETQAQLQADTANAANQQLQDQLTAALKKNQTVIIGATCKNAMDYLRQQAHSFSHPSS